MQKKIEGIQAELDARSIEVSSGGGAVSITISGSGVFQGLKLDPELLKEEASLVEETILEAIKEAAAKSKKINDDEMAKATEGFALPGLM
ncbi:YbaB/EbfC family nucleoid-associated protein [Puniceicoccaceae bacterium K14]|nr:YbaB/EbfC family nucleoid-associated protein [Puniceicoccaceae bacterium K14]